MLPARAAARPEWRSITVAPRHGDPGHDGYIGRDRATTGKTGAGPFEVQFADGAIARLRRRDSPRARCAHTRRRSVRFIGPPCSASTPATITVDPTEQVDDVESAQQLG